MSIGVDARWMVGDYRGMGRYAHALIEPIRRDVIGLLPAGSGEAAPFPCVRAGRGFFPYWEQLELPRLCATEGVNELLCPYNTAPLKLPSSTTLTLVVHDLIYLEPWRQLPPSVSAYQTLGRIYRRYVVPRVVDRAHRLVTVSEYSRRQICELFRVDEDAVQVIPNSLGPDWYGHEPVPRSARKRYLFAVGGEAPSKNMPRLIQAFARLRQMLGPHAADVTLRVAGIKPAQHDHFRRLAARSGVSEQVVFESFVGEEALRKLYREAWLFTMPSLYEGFGIPLLEAMASGTPVVCSNTSSLPEVACGAGWMFDPRQVENMAETLCEAWLDDAALAAHASKGLQRAASFSREAVAETIAAFWGASR